jgi:hypothetical protein
MDNAKKHIEKTRKYIDAKLGKGKGSELLSEFEEITGNETPKETAKWAASLINHLENNIDEKDLIEIREECSCIKANKNSKYAKEYFPKLKKKFPNDNDYLNACSEFMTKKKRCGKRIEAVKGELISHFSFANQCCCYVIKGGWEKPPTAMWCRCCCGTIKSVYQFVFPERECHVDIMETFATGGNDCVFRTWFTEGE